MTAAKPASPEAIEAARTLYFALWADPHTARESDYEDPREYAEKCKQERKRADEDVRRIAHAFDTFATARREAGEGEGEVAFNMNDKVRVVLNDRGAKVWNDRQREYETMGKGLIKPDYKNAGTVMEEQLWVLMETFGPAIHHWEKPPFLNNRVVLLARGAAPSTPVDDGESVAAGRQVTTSLAEFRHKCEVLIEEEQAKIAPETHLIAVLCEAIRLTNEFTDHARSARVTPPRGESAADAGPRGALTLDAFQKINERRCVEHFKHELGSWSLLEWAGALAGEIGETANVAKKIRRVEQGIKDWKGENVEVAALRKMLADEIGDSMAYLVLLASAAGLSIEACAADKFDKVSEKAGWSGPRLRALASSVAGHAEKRDEFTKAALRYCEVEAHMADVRAKDWDDGGAMQDAWVALDAAYAALARDGDGGEAKP